METDSVQFIDLFVCSKLAPTTMTDERRTKRPRLDGSGKKNDIVADDDDDKEDDDNLADMAAAFLDGDDDDFVSQQSRQEAEAERRRQQRRERLRRIAAEKGESRNDANRKIEPQPAAPASQVARGKSADNRDAKVAISSEPPDEGNDKESGTESFDMFTSTPPPPPPKKGDEATNTAKPSLSKNNNNNNNRGQGQQDWDDAEGYYNAVIGETIELHDNPSVPDDYSRAKQVQQKPPSASLSFRVDGVIGKGVFSTVLKVTTMSNTSSTPVPPTVAMKMIRHNETMAKAAINEIRFLRELREARGIIPLLLPTSVVNLLEHRGHVMLLFPYVEYNLRDVLQKFGKGVGLSLPAVRSYFGQLLAALTHLQKRDIIHADIKPDNILVHGDFNNVYLADFGSAFGASAPENQPTPYLVSRFYRAPEIVLGLTPTISIDLWSLAVSAAELFLGNVLFRGKSNNDMLYVFMQHLGAFSNRVVRQHIVQLGKLPTLARQFDKSDGANFHFLHQTVDTVTGNPIHERLALVSSTTSAAASALSGGARKKFPSATPLAPKILRAKSATDARSEVQKFADLLAKCLALDPSRRIALKDALRHEFFQAKAAPTGAATTTK